LRHRDNELYGILREREDRDCHFLIDWVGANALKELARHNDDFTVGTLVEEDLGQPVWGWHKDHSTGRLNSLDLNRIIVH